MVIYPDRGLVTQNGKIYKLFEQLYTVISITLNSVGGSLVLVGNILYTDNEGIFSLICSNCKDRIKSGNYSVKLIHVTLCFQSAMFVISSIIFYSIRKYIKRKSGSINNKKIPIKFGQYQRNIVTLSQTMFIGMYTLITNAILVIFPLVIDDLANSFVRNFVFIFQLSVFDIILSFLMPVMILYNLRTKLPDFYIKNRRVIENKPIFYIFMTDFLPRDVDLEKNSQQVFHNDLMRESQSQNNLIYVKETVHI